MAHAKQHDYHILPPSIYPLIGAVGAFCMLTGAVIWMHGSAPWLFLIGAVALAFVMIGWWSDVVTESNAGDHTPVVRIGLRYGFIMFVMSEVMFFVAWFWAFFKHQIYPMSAYEGSQYVTPEFYQLDVFHLPLMNTVVLLLSGCAVTWAHHELVHGGDRKNVANGLLIGILLGLAFTGLQAFEYYELLVHEDWSFGGDRFFGTFFMATGFHGAHVIIGTIFLTVCYFRVLSGHFTAEKHVGFEAAAWYWHFVDVVWLFLFAAVYIWALG
ncbi:cytochrome c oxidase subunit 3 [Rhodobacterales bacterium HKCCE3408]|nr:cytochrome c oxidase subunit 3 [Rhodobacterales bacterium HKCCE3408]